MSFLFGFDFEGTYEIKKILPIILNSFDNNLDELESKKDFSEMSLPQTGKIVITKESKDIFSLKIDNENQLVQNDLFIYAITEDLLSSVSQINIINSSSIFGSNTNSFLGIVNTYVKKINNKLLKIDLLFDYTNTITNTYINPPLYQVIKNNKVLVTIIAKKIF